MVAVMFINFEGTIRQKTVGRVYSRVIHSVLLDSFEGDAKQNFNWLPKGHLNSVDSRGNILEDLSVGLLVNKWVRF